MCRNIGPRRQGFNARHDDTPRNTIKPSAESVCSFRSGSTFEIDGYHHLEALLGHVFEQQELAITRIYEDAVQVPELALDRGVHRVEVREIADVRANGETSGSERLLSRLQRPFIQAADGNARALSVEFLRCGEPDSAIAAGDEDVLVRSLTWMLVSI